MFGLGKKRQCARCGRDFRGEGRPIRDRQNRQLVVCADACVEALRQKWQAAYLAEQAQRRERRVARVRALVEQGAYRSIVASYPQVIPADQVSRVGGVPVGVGRWPREDGIPSLFLCSLDVRGVEAADGAAALAAFAMIFDADTNVFDLCGIELVRLSESDLRRGETPPPEDSVLAADLLVPGVLTVEAPSTGFDPRGDYPYPSFAGGLPEVYGDGYDPRDHEDAFIAQIQGDLLRRTRPTDHEAASLDLVGCIYLHAHSVGFETTD